MNLIKDKKQNKNKVRNLTFNSSFLYLSVSLFMFGPRLCFPSTFYMSKRDVPYFIYKSRQGKFVAHPPIN